MKYIEAATDAWREVEPGSGIDGVVSPHANVLLTVEQWRAARAAWPGETSIGLLLRNDEDVELIAGDLGRFGLIVLQFPKWTDGRAYSQARLLRSRHRFSGEVRATGEVLVDMLPLLARTGFDAVALRADQSRAAADQALSFFAEGFYQADVVATQPRFRRVAPAAA